MPKRRPPMQPFVYGKYLIEYRKVKGGLLRFHKEHINTLERANEVCKELLAKDYHDPVVKKIG